MRSLGFFVGVGILSMVLVPSARAGARVGFVPKRPSPLSGATIFGHHATQPGYPSGRAPLGFHPGGIVQPGAQPGASPKTLLGWPGLFPGVPGGNPGSLRLAVSTGAPGPRPVQPSR
jgi:hypothetical protein